MYLLCGSNTVRPVYWIVKTVRATLGSANPSDFVWSGNFALNPLGNDIHILRTSILRMYLYYTPYDGADNHGVIHSWVILLSCHQYFKLELTLRTSSSICKISTGPTRRTLPSSSGRTPMSQHDVGSRTSGGRWTAAEPSFAG